MNEWPPASPGTTANTRGATTCWCLRKFGGKTVSLRGFDIATKDKRLRFGKVRSVLAERRSWLIAAQLINHSAFAGNVQIKIDKTVQKDSAKAYCGAEACHIMNFRFHFAERGGEENRCGPLLPALCR